MRDDISETVLTVEDMVCSHCVSMVEQAVLAVGGVASAVADLDTKLVRIYGSAAIESMIAAIEATGKSAELLPSSSRIVLHVEGMMCDHCRGHVDEAVRRVHGVDTVEVDLEAKQTIVHGTAFTADLVEAISAAGFTARPTTAITEQSGTAVSSCNGAQAAMDEVAAAGARAKSRRSHEDSRVQGGAAGHVSTAGAHAAVSLPSAWPSSPESPATGSQVAGMSPTLKRTSFVRIDGLEREAVLSIGGMSCAACVGAVERSLNKLPGVSAVSVSLMGKRGQVFYVPEQVDVDAICQAVMRAGYQAAPLMGTSLEQPPSNAYAAEATSYRRQFLGSLPFTIGAMLVSKVLPIVGSESVKRWLSWTVVPGLSRQTALLLLLVTPVQFGFGLPFFQRAAGACRGGAANMDVLVVLGTTTAYCYSTFFTAVSIRTGGRFGEENTCFETAAMLITFMLLGKFLETSAKGRATEAVSKLLTLRPPTALRLVGGLKGMAPRDPHEAVEKVSVSRLLPGHVVKVLPGATVPADGLVLQGESSVNESMITGEAVPVHKQPGDSAIGGTVNAQGVLWVRVLAVGSESVLAKIMKLVSDAQMRKPQVQALADVVAAYFVPLVVILSLFAWVAWASAVYLGEVTPHLVELSGLADGYMMAFMFGAATLVIACPCTLGLATPTAVMVGSGVGAQLGMLFKGGDVLEKASGVTCIVFDKTGTLTKGTLEVQQVVSWGHGQRASRERVLLLAASAEQHSEHPIGRAVVSAARELGVSMSAASDFEAKTGLGVSCTVDSMCVLLGNRDWLAQNELHLSARHEADAVRREEAGETVILVAAAGEVIGMIALGDTIKREAPQVVRQLQQLGIKVWMATGDNQRTARHVAQRLGIIDWCVPCGPPAPTNACPLSCTCVGPGCAYTCPPKYRSPSPWRAPSFHPEPHPSNPGACSLASSRKGRKHRSQRFVRRASLSRWSATASTMRLLWHRLTSVSRWARARTSPSRPPTWC